MYNATRYSFLAGLPLKAVRVKNTKIQPLHPGKVAFARRDVKQ
jgi:hypothetical protein